MSLVTLDTGALISIERHKLRAASLVRSARERGVGLTTITPVMCEWWRGRTDDRDLIRGFVRVVPLSVHVAATAGEALGRLGRVAGAALTIDVMVVAFAALEGGQIVYTSDVDDLSRIAAACFPSVRVLGL
jgi:predicted nucleic acid-binding protein